jgi:hypothetical protein
MKSFSWRHRLRADEGSVLLLGLGFMAVALLAVSVATDAALAFVQRSALQARADAAVLAGVQAIDIDAYYRYGATSATALVPSEARARVLSHFQRSLETTDISGASIVSLVATPNIVHVRIEAPVRTAFWPIQAAISVESQAQLDYVG